MAHEITIPRLGWSMEEGVLGRWLKSPGQSVRRGEMLFTLEGEKAAEEIESFDAGYLWIPADAPRPGSTVKVGQVIGFLLAEGESAPTTVGSAAQHGAVPQTVPETPRRLPRPAGPAARRLARQLGIDLDTVPSPDPTGRVIDDDVRRMAHRPSTARPVATPRARRRAKELGLDWTTLSGSGRGGRIRERDVVERLPSGHSESAPASPGQHTPASKRRLTIAQRMVAGVTQAAPVTLTTKIDARPLVDFRNERKRTANGDAPSYHDILIQLVAATLRELPQLNACWHRDGIYQYDDIHIALAVDCEAGLLAPVVRHADRLSLDEITSRTRQLIADARANRLSQQLLEVGTFTITSLGAFGIDAFTPILNLPQAGILGVGRIVEEPIVRDGQIVAGHTLCLSLTFDHRIVDGAPAAKWLSALCAKIVSIGSGSTLGGEPATVS